jgi:hypothetical protein
MSGAKSPKQGTMVGQNAAKDAFCASLQTCDEVRSIRYASDQESWCCLGLNYLVSTLGPVGKMDFLLGFSITLVLSSEFHSNLFLLGVSRCDFNVSRFFFYTLSCF